ncbi:MAG: hypothetical protein WCT07_03990 [Candidatus Paceibacterota bacterium]
MKKFTLKDFILYNGPCFSCGNKVAIKMVYANDNQFGGISQSIKNDKLIATLNIKYSFELNISISISDNKFQVTDMEKFLTYLGSRDLHMVSNCKNCQGLIYSNPLEFDSHMFIKPFTILRELLSTTENDMSYSLMSEYSENETQINILNNNTNKMMIMTVPLLPLYKFKTKEKLVKKLRTYVIFS